MKNKPLLGIVLYAFFIALFVFSCQNTDQNQPSETSEELALEDPSSELLFDEEGEDFDIGAERFLGQISGSVDRPTATPVPIALKDPVDQSLILQPDGQPYQFLVDSNTPFNIDVEFSKEWVERPILIEIPGLNESTILFFDRTAFRLQDSAVVAHSDIFPSTLGALFAERLLTQFPQVLPTRTTFLEQQNQFEAFLGLQNSECFPPDLKTGIRQTNLECNPQFYWKLAQLNSLFEMGSAFINVASGQSIEIESLIRAWAESSLPMSTFQHSNAGITLLPATWHALSALEEEQTYSLFFEGASDFLEHLAQQSGGDKSVTKFGIRREGLSSSGVSNRQQIVLESGKSNLLGIAQKLANPSESMALSQDELKIYAQGLLIKADQTLETLLETPTEQFADLNTQELEAQVQAHQLSAEAIEDQWELLRLSLASPAGLISQLSTNKDLALFEIEALVSWNLDLQARQLLSDRVLLELNPQVTSLLFLNTLKNDYEVSALPDHMPFDRLIETLVQVVDPILVEHIQSLDSEELEVQLQEHQGELLEQVVALGKLSMSTLNVLLQVLGTSSPHVLHDILSDPQEILLHINMTELLSPLCKEESPCLPPASQISGLQTRLEDKLRDFKAVNVTVIFRTSEAFWQKFDSWYTDL